MRAFLFPGQGSQAVGMGRDLFERIPESRRVFEAADSVLGFPLSKICFEGPEDELKKTPTTQPALLAVSLAALGALRTRGASYQAVSGHSLGAYGALVAAGVLETGDALRLVRRRGELMEEAGRGRGTMGVILQLDEDLVAQACREASDAGVVESANVNCPGQIVISGEKAAVSKALEKAKALGAKRAMELPVSGPFHSSLMAPAAEAFRAVLEKVEFRKPGIRFYSDVDAGPLDDPALLRDSLVRQLTSPVQWIRTIRRMSSDGVSSFVEVGSGKVLAGLVKKILEGADVVSVGDSAAVESLPKD